jgi:hypothetical protein
MANRIGRERAIWYSTLPGACASPDFVQVIQSVETIESSIRDTQRTLAAVSGQVGGVRKQLEKVIEFTGGAENRLCELEQRTGDLLLAYQEKSEEIKGLEARLCRIEGLVAEVIERSGRAGSTPKQTEPGVKKPGKS